jgi:hypothetical protein
MIASLNPPPVVAVPDWTNAAMGPPPIPRHRAITGPDVVIPTSWQGPTSPPIPSRLTGTVGYSSHHGLYAGERLRWAKAAYAGPGAALAAKTISLEISAVHEAGGCKKSRGIPIGVQCFLAYSLKCALIVLLSRPLAKARKILMPASMLQVLSSLLWRQCSLSYMPLVVYFLGVMKNSSYETQDGWTCPCTSH